MQMIFYKSEYRGAVVKLPSGVGICCLSTETECKLNNSVLYFGRTKAHPYTLFFKKTYLRVASCIQLFVLLLFTSIFP